MSKFANDFASVPRMGAVIIAFALAGCSVGSDAPEIAPVSGTVTVKGQPKADLNVTFYPETGGRPASGRTDADGKFILTTLNTGDGAPVGTNKATVKAGANPVAMDPINGPPMPGQPGYKEWMKQQSEQIDSKYGSVETSGLVYTVPSDGIENLEIKLQ